MSQLGERITLSLALLLGVVSVWAVRNSGFDTGAVSLGLIQAILVAGFLLALAAVLASVVREMSGWMPSSPW